MSYHKKTVLQLEGILACISVFLCLCWIAACTPFNQPLDTAQATRWREPLVPTPQSGNIAPMPTRPAQKTVLLEPNFVLAPLESPAPYTLRWRIGVGVPEFNPLLFAWPALRPGWYLNWAADLGQLSVQETPPDILYLEAPTHTHLGMEFLPMVRVHNGKPSLSSATLRKLAAENPGRTWLVGNEPDVRWQDNSTPEEYAHAYYAIYHTIKIADPSAQVAIGGISQVTPLRLLYLDRVLAAYQTAYGQPMPVDVWNMHAFVLREEANNWGVDIPPGFPSLKVGMLWEVEDHNNLQLVENQVRLMRTWMEKQGQRQKPLMITEYGILMPGEYGFPPEVVKEFMWKSFDLFNSLHDPQLGYSADGDRLVQRWCWFSTRYSLYPTGDLFDKEGQTTYLMETLRDYLIAHAHE